MDNYQTIITLLVHNLMLNHIHLVEVSTVLTSKRLLIFPHLLGAGYFGVDYNNEFGQKVWEILFYTHSKM